MDFSQILDNILTNPYSESYAGFLLGVSLSALLVLKVFLGYLAVLFIGWLRTPPKRSELFIKLKDIVDKVDSGDGVEVVDDRQVMAWFPKTGSLGYDSYKFHFGKFIVRTYNGRANKIFLCEDEELVAFDNSMIANHELEALLKYISKITKPIYDSLKQEESRKEKAKLLSMLSEK